jgi:hypothetical protein
MWRAGRVSSRSGFEDHVEGHLCGAAEIAEPTGGDDLAEARLAGPGQDFARFRCRQRKIAFSPSKIAASASEI